MPDPSGEPTVPPQTTDPHAALAGAVIEHVHAALDSLADSISGLGADELNATAGPDTNSLAVLVTHTVETARSIAHHLADDPMPRDRVAAFRVTGMSEAELRAMLEACSAELDDLVARAMSAPLDRPVARHRVASQAWWLLQLAGHTREHAAHATLTRQLVERRPLSAGAGGTRPVRRPAARRGSAATTP